MDCADGAGTLLLDLKKRDWSTEVLAALDIPRLVTADLRRARHYRSDHRRGGSGHRVTCWDAFVVAGGGDQAAQAVGVGAVQEGIIALTLGTSGVVFGSVNHPFFEPEGRSTPSATRFLVVGI